MSRHALPLLLLLLAPLARAQDPPRERFTFGGVDLTAELPLPFFTLDGAPRRLPREGDVVNLGRVLVVLGRGPDYRFAFDEGRRCVTLGDPGRPVAWQVTERTRDAFLAADDETLRGLWGVRLDVWDDEIATAVSKLDPARTCVTLAVRRPEGIPPLPPALQHLALEHPPADLAGLTLHPELRFLQLGVRARPIATRDLAPLGELRCLILEEPCDGPLVALPRLASLTLSQGQEDVALATGAPRLVRLSLRRTRVKDLSPLDGHKHLAWLDARGAGLLERLPEALPALVEADLQATALGDADVAAFARGHPRARVLHRGDDLLRGALARATRLRVRSGGGCHRERADERTLFEVTDPAAIAHADAHLELAHEGSGSCLCCGGPTLEVWAGDELAASLTVHHGQALRWGAAWAADAPLSGRAARWLERWLASEGEVAGWPPAPPSDHDGRVTALAFSPDGERLLSAGTDGALRLWSTEGVSRGGSTPLASDVAQVTRLAAYARAPHPDPDVPPALVAVTFTPDGAGVVVGDAYGVLRLLPATLEGPGRALADERAAGAHSFSLSADGRLLATVTAERVDVRDLGTGELVRSFDADLPWATISPDGARLVCAENHSLRVVSLESVALDRVLTPAEGARRLLFSRDGQSLAAIGAAAAWFDLRDGRKRWSVPVTDVRAATVVDDRWLAVYQGKRGTVDFLDLETGTSTRAVKVAAQAEWHVAALSRDGRWLAVGVQGDVRVHDLAPP